MKFFVITVSILLVSAAYADSYQDLQPGRWVQVGTNTIDDLDPQNVPALNPNFCDPDGNGLTNSDCNAPYHGVGGLSSMIGAWNGGAFASNYGSLGGLVVWGGGHKSYYGNEVYVFNIAANKWERLSNPYFNPGDTELGPSSCSQATGEFPDGSPCTSHTYDFVEYHPPTNSFVVLGAYALHEKGGGGSPRPHMFDLDTRKWRHGNDQPGVDQAGPWSSAYDSKRNVMWLIPGSSQLIGRFSVESGSWAMQASGIDYQVGDSLTAYDKDRDLVVTFDYRHGARQFKVRRAGNMSSPFIAKMSGPLDIFDSSKEEHTRPGFEYDEANKVFVAWRGGRHVYTVTPPGDLENGTWVIERVNLGGANPSTPAANGTYSRMRFAPKIGAFIVANSSDEGAYMFMLGECSECPPVDTVEPDQPTNLKVIQ